MLWIAGDENKKSLIERGITFDEIIDAIESGCLLDIIQNSYDDNSQIALVKIGTSLWAVPFEPRGENYRIITAYKKSQWKKKFPTEFPKK